MPYQMSVTVAEERIRDSGKVGRRVSSEADLIRMLQSLLPGWDIDVATTDRGETIEEIIDSWRRPGLLVKYHPELRGDGSRGSPDALAAISAPMGMHESEGLLMFLYQDISDMNELIVIHEVAHALTVDFDAAHSERWLDTYLKMLGNAGLQEAVNLISFMTGKTEIKFVEGRRRRIASRPSKVFIRNKVHYADPKRNYPGHDRPMPLCGTKSQQVLPSAEPDDTPVDCEKCLNIRAEGRRRQAAFYKAWEKPAAAYPMADSYADAREGFARTRKPQDFILTDEGLVKEKPVCVKCGNRIEVGGGGNRCVYYPKSKNIEASHYMCTWGQIMDDVMGEYYERNASLKKGAPFAGYDDFADCVNKNSDKNDPEAYCGSIKRKTEGSRLHHPRYRSIR